MFGVKQEMEMPAVLEMQQEFSECSNELVEEGLALAVWDVQHLEDP